MRKTGQEIEQWVCKELIQCHLILIEQNYTTPLGEVDLIMMDPKNNTLIFIEVRYRKNGSYGEGFETVTRTKQRKIIKTAKCYVQHKPAFANRALRFDVISVSGPENNLRLDWIPDAFM